jgi:hypothetical protein
MSKDKIMEKPSIGLRHDAVNELLGAAPGWLIRWGISVFCGAIAVLLVGAYFFKYPVVIIAPITVTTEQPAIWVVAQASGRIDSIYVEDHAFVEKDCLLAALITTYSKAIPFAGELTGTAEIAAEEMSLLEHLVNPLKYLWSRTGEK